MVERLLSRKYNKIDETERLRRLEDARKRLDQIGKNDPGGDITI